MNDTNKGWMARSKSGGYELFVKFYLPVSWPLCLHLLLFGMQDGITDYRYFLKSVDVGLVVMWSKE